MARVLIVGGGRRSIRLAEVLLADGHAVRIVTRTVARREEIEATGAQCWIGTPDRLATLRGALEHVTIACWLLAGASGEEAQVQALHGSRLEQFLHGAIDSTVRGFVYEAGGALVDAELLERGERIVSETAARNSIPISILKADPLEIEAWMAQALRAIASLLEGSDTPSTARYPPLYT